jgi:hypothetical protein
MCQAVLVKAVAIDVEVGMVRNQDSEEGTFDVDVVVERMSFPSCLGLGSVKKTRSRPWLN